MVGWLQKENVRHGQETKRHSLEFKLEAVRQAVELGRAISDVADGLGINRNMLTLWKARYAPHGVVSPTPADQQQRDLEAENRELRRELSIARQERDILKMRRPTSRENRAEVSVRSRPPGDLRGGPDVYALEVSRSGFYAWLKRPESHREIDKRRLTGLIRGVFKESRKTYGSARIHSLLIRRGIECGLNRVARLMRRAGLRPIPKKRFRPQTTDSKHSNPVAPNLLDQNFAMAKKPNEIFVSDITYIATDQGWLYLATTMDRCSRKIVGWAMSASLAATSVTSPLQMAIERRSPPPGLIHHSDRGVQYSSKEFRDFTRDHGIRLSMSRKGNCYDNAVMESFYHTLKTELVDRQRYRTRAEARASLFEYIEAFYNRQRLHSSLGYQSPAELELAAA